jgi:type III restriction enzyme
MKIQFDSKQQYQLDAVSAVADIFDGQPFAALDFTTFMIEESLPLFQGQTRTELGMGNQFLLSADKLKKNVRAVQERNDIEFPNADTELESWPLLGQNNEFLRHCYHFSVEMETGTGKTYVYLRTIFELSKRYGFKKFIIVVPSVAIREGVLKNIEITAEHFKALYNNVEFESFVYDARKVNKLRQFAVSNTIQLLVINIDAFRKNFTGTDAENKSNVIYKESDRLSGRQPIEFVQATNPIVIIDEPQSVDSTDKAQEAIKALNPLCTLRYSATHRNPYNLVYRLDPIRAFELRLVKQIVVGSSVASGHMNDAFVRVESIDAQNGIRAKLRIHMQTAEGPKEKLVTIKKNGTDLFEVSNNRACYRDGFEVTEISAEPGNELVRFNNGTVLQLGQEIGGMREDVWQVQIVNTVRKHLDKELEVKGKGLKVLSLFFIDRVANYRFYDESGHPQQGKFAQELEKAIATLSKEKKYKAIEWLKIPVEKLHNGYFAQDKRGILKDTKGDTQADDDVYNLIMKEKEQLLSIDVPLRFIFSHSALREGWDNPNVFQICTLNETRSVMKKRQEIGRGLRLPVNQNGERVFDESINKLFVVANESYEDFARALQTEYEEDCGFTFGKVPITAFARLELLVDDQPKPLGREASNAIWTSLVNGGILAPDGKIQPSFDPKREGYSLPLPEEHKKMEKSITEILSSYQIERHIRKERDEGFNRLKKTVQLSPEFSALWERIKPKTTFRVEFATDELVTKAVSAIRGMPKIEPAVVNFDVAALDMTKAGVTARTLRTSQETIRYAGGLPDLLAYLQNETELTRSTLVRILRESGRLSDFFINPQRFMDGVASVLKYELHRLLVDGIKYERIPTTDPDSEWEMMLFKNEEIINYLTALQVNKSVYEYVVFDSDVEREFAKKLDEREDIKLFVKLPGWFEIETPIGKYNPDWAILKHNDHTLYLVRETKSTHDFLKLRTSEADKVRCGQRHFEAIGVPFAVAVTADEV